PIMSDDAVSLLQEEEHLRIPVVGAKWPSMMEDDRLSVLRAPVLEVDFRAVLRSDRAHGHCSFAYRSGWRGYVRLRRRGLRQTDGTGRSDAAHQKIAACQAFC